MSELRAVEPNGCKVASTFSGCGGSCLGYRMAGYDVVWANEFTKNARDSYLANWPEATVDPRDIKTVQPDEILAATGLAVGQLDLFDGSPPCQAFSTAGKREKGWGKNKKYDNGIEQKNERLFDEYVRLLQGLQPKCFIAENVRGLIIGSAKGMYLEISAALSAAGYRVRSFVLDAQWLGTPQVRKRLIFVGIRNDLDASGYRPPDPLPYRYSVRDAIGDVAAVGSIRKTGFGQGKSSPADEPSPTLLGGGGGGMNTSQFGVIEKQAGDLEGTAVGRAWKRIKPGEKSEKYLNLIRAHEDSPLPTATVIGGSAAGVSHPTECRKFSIAELRRLSGFPDDFVLCGGYAKQWMQLGNAVAPQMAAAVGRSLLPILRQV